MHSGKKPLTRAAARTAALVNLLAAPGLGTLVVGKRALGFAQLAVALTGFVLVIVWLAAVLRQYYTLITSNVEIKSVAWIGLLGAFLFVAAWTWSLVTSISLMREARRNAAAPAAPPVISP